MNDTDVLFSKQYFDLYSEHKKLLKLVANENSIETILNEIIKSVEARNNHMICSILLLDESGKRLSKGAAPSLPEDYTSKLNNMLIGEKVGSCGAAVYLKKRVIISDISTNENWKYAKNLANKFNLCACWSQPFFSSSNKVLGSFAIYYKEIKEPTDFDIHLIEDIASITGIAIEKYQSALKEEIYKEKLNEINQSLEQKVLERTSELEDSNYELEQTITNLKFTQEKLIESEKMASLGGLVAGVAHEINTPVGVSLTGITHFLDITKDIKKEYISDNMTKQEFENYLTTSEKLARQINTNLERTAHLIRSFKQVAVDQTNDEKRIFELESYLHEVIFSLEHIIKKTNLKINMKTMESININSYPGAYSQIITNLIMNSIRHAYSKNEKGTIIIELIEEESTVHINYKDDGKGISEENLPKIFDPFFTTNREDGGTGLGLNIIYNIVTSNLNGTIMCASKEGDGVEFRMIIPTSN